MSLEKYRARSGLAVPIAAVGLVAAAGALLVLLADRPWRIVVAAVAFAAAVAGAVLLLRRARKRDRERNDALAQAEARHRALLDGLPLVTWLTAIDEAQDTLYVSPGIAELLGYTATEWADQPDLHSRLLHPDDRERVLAELAHAREGTPVSTDYRLLARDGRAVWVRHDSSTVRDAEGEALYVQTFLWDIGDLKRAEERREQVQAAERGAVDESAERQGRLDLLRRAGQDLAATVELDAALRRLAELAVANVADWCVIDLVDDHNTLRRLAVARGRVVSQDGVQGPAGEPEDEVRAVFESGRTRVLPPLGESTAGERFAAAGGLEARSVVCAPVWARKHPLGALTLIRTDRGGVFTADDVALAEDLAARIALALDRARLYREVEERSDAAWVLEHVADGVLLLDRTGVVRLWNPAAEAITLITADEVVGRLAAEAIPGWKSAVETVPVSASPDPGHDEVLVPIETSRGERWIAISGVRFFGGTVYAFRDLTDARRLEEIKADFIATASHELRTPLAAVYGAAQTLLRHDFALDEPGRERFVSLIADESERLGRIVNEILLANQLDAGRLDLELEPFDGRDLVERVVEATRVHAPPSVVLEIEGSDYVSPVAADIDKVRQVLVNLLENAIKYSPDGGRVEIGIDEQEGFIRFNVRDEGLGVSPEDQERIFEKFYRADPQMVRGVGGTGLGLYICKELIDRMGGRIWVEPNGDRGSNFAFDLPTAEVMAHGGAGQRRLQ
ncbi:MAG TPA: ATP-binding protein [Gaiellaceae bacterium]|nr:ATP-binding protein [Gaiellaceae bacterium]